MRLDIRLPIGLMFLTFGVILSGFGIFGEKAIYRASLGVNVNLIWGLVLIAFGAVMLLLGWRAGKRVSPNAREALEKQARASH
jgi:hypothetical protein